MKPYDEILTMMETGPVFVFTVVKGPYTGEKMAMQSGRIRCWNAELLPFWEEVVSGFDRSGCPCTLTLGDRRVFVERLMEEPSLVICGGGHISRELAALADFLEYPYTVIDDRPEFVAKERFPGARERICLPFRQVFEERIFPGNVYYVIVTRGHAHDLSCLEAVLGRPFGYAGMIGSRKKVEKTMDILKQKGYAEELLNAVHAPIGLPIGGQTPREIAVSIAAQLIETKNREQPSGYVDGEMKEALSGDRPLVMAGIIEKKGSAPRGVGSRMLVDESGIVCGTIGGGPVEFEAEKRAKQLVRTGETVIESYRLDADTAASLGMWCGGEVTVLFEA